MPGTRDLAGDVDIDVAGLFAEVWRKRWVVGTLILAVGFIILTLTLYVKPRYDASARILIEKRELVFTRPASAETRTDDSRFDEQAVGSQVQVLTSDDIALKVIAALKLDQTAEFSGGSLFDNLLETAGLKSSATGVSAAARSLTEFKKHLTVFAADRSRVLVVEFWSHDPALAQAVPNAIADEYLNLTKQAKIESNNEATKWLGPEIDDLRAKVRAAEAKVAEFRANSDILDGTNNSPLITQQLSEVSSQLSQLRAQRSAAEAKAASIRAALESGASLDAIPEVIASPLIQRLRERQVQLRAEISDLSTTMLPNHPRLKALQSQLNDFDRQIRAETNNILKGLQSNADVLKDQEEGLLRDVDRLKAEAGRAGEAEVELRALEREATAQRELLQSYLTQYREAASRQNSEYLPVDARIISRAVRPVEPYFPKIVPMVASGMVATLVLTVVGILSWALMSGRAFRPVFVDTQERMPERLEIPEPRHAEAADGWEVEGEAKPRAAAPRPAPVEEDAVVAAPPAGSGAASRPRPPEAELPQVEAPPLESPVRRTAEQARERIAERPAQRAVEPANDAGDGPVAGIERFGLRHACQAIEELGPSRIAVISPAGDEGSIVAWLLARRLSAHRQSVAIVDLTGSGVTGTKMLGEGQFAGLRDLLAGTVRYQEALHRDRASDAIVVPAGVTTEPAALDRLPLVVEAVAEEHDFQIYDCGYAGAQALKLIADPQTIVIVSAEGASDFEIGATIVELAGAGFHEAIVVGLDSKDRQVALAGAA